MVVSGRDADHQGAGVASHAVSPTINEREGCEA